MIQRAPPTRNAGTAAPYPKMVPSLQPLDFPVQGPLASLYAKGVDHDPARNICIDIGRHQPGSNNGTHLRRKHQAAIRNRIKQWFDAEPIAGEKNIARY